MNLTVTLFLLLCGAASIWSTSAELLDEAEDLRAEGEGIEKRQSTFQLDPGNLAINRLIRPPPATLATLRPRRVIFDDSTTADTNPSFGFRDLGVSVADSSKADELNSEWSVITPQGFVYSGSPTVLRQEFQKARADLLGGLTLAGRGDPSDDFRPSLSFSPPGLLQGFSKKRSVFPPDTRQKVSSPHIYPWSSMGRVDSGCTGTFIGPRHVLTAGHCVFNFKTKRWYRNLNFRRAKNCNPHGGTLYQWRYAISVKGWTKYGYQSYDYAMIVVDRASPYRMDIGYVRRMPKWIVNINGYPKDKPGRCMWHSNCKIQHVFSKQLGYKCDTFRGSSGSSVYAYWKNLNRRVIYCIHAYGKSFSKNYNKCTRITKSRYHQLKDWIKKY